jgi:hypothetical protein
MAEPDLSFLLRVLREIQAEQRTLRDENARISQELATKASRSETLAILNQVINRFSEFEARMESHFDDLQRQIGSLQRPTCRSTEAGMGLPQ